NSSSIGCRSRVETDWTNDFNTGAAHMELLPCQRHSHSDFPGLSAKNPRGNILSREDKIATKVPLTMC
ncbi:MAG TPA: hypothetical protein VLB05_06035, partial [Dongiaceae bacterium]|nr:hypothetical protein [Dongiaceae bacterium]